MRLDELLFSQGFGTRRHCAALLAQGHVAVGGQVLRDPDAWLDVGDAAAPLRFSVQGQVWLYQPRAYLMLHKPAGYECSQKPGAWPSVYTLLPAPLRQRPPATRSGARHPGVQAVGRLDQDTTGLLLLSDDGAFIHRLSAPRHHMPKVYELRCAQPIDARQVQALLAGVTLRDDPAPVRAADCEATGTHSLRMTLTQGKYHQVKRMLAAVGNRVLALHRSQIGQLSLPDELPPGQWRWLTADDLAALSWPPTVSAATKKQA